MVFPPMTNMKSHTLPIALLALGFVALSNAEAQKASAKATKPTKAPAPAAAATAAPVDGAKVFATTCAACHQVSGDGLEDRYPPLNGSEWVTGDEQKLIRIVMNGLSGPVEVAGQTFDGAMPPWGGILKDPEIAAVTSYVRGAWGNKAAPIAAATVTTIRGATRARKTPWTAAEIAKVPATVK
jgi:mono/diheme cytochrome c family protein